ncbi:MAG: PEP-CTERM sorting domain-containing protein [Phycisphaerae bacterium]
MTRCRGIWGLVVAVMAVLLGCAGLATAGPIAGDPNAMPAWQGTQQFYATSGVRTLQVDVEYAVYAPGNYGLSGTDPSGDTQYVYAYQVFNDLGGNRPVSSFSVGLDPTANVANSGFDAGSGTLGGTAPTASGFIDVPPTSALWSFLLNTIDPPPANEYSTVLLFTSPYGPQWAPATVIDGGLGNTQDLPSPTPEPATLALMALGGVGLLARRRREK